jgi:hypothetical protein
MNNILGHPIKNIFSQAALKVLNACAKFAYNFANGFGIKLTRSANSVVVSLDTESDALASWVKDIAKPQAVAKDANENLEENDGGDSQSLLSGLTLDTTTWERGVTTKKKKSGDSWVDVQDDNGNKILTGVRMQVVSRVVRAYDTDFFFWRWAYFDKAGALYRLSAEQGVFAEVNYDKYVSI